MSISGYLALLKRVARWALETEKLDDLWVYSKIKRSQVMREEVENGDREIEDKKLQRV